MKTGVLKFLGGLILATMSHLACAQDADAQLLTAVKELKAQQSQFVDNEAKVEAKVIELAETIRVARIFISRAGGAHKLPPPKK